MADDGTVSGADEAVEALSDANPFILAPAPDGPPAETNPFKPTGSSGRAMNGKKKSTDTYDRSRLEKLYPALRRGR